MATDGSSGGTPPRDAAGGAATQSAAAGPPTAPASARDVELVFVIFQGGGAKGITHVGALKALEDERLLPYGVAGTSAGAIVAALVAVGYSADELLNPANGTTILEGASPITHLGSAAWSRFVRIRQRALPLAILAASAVMVLLTALVWSILTLSFGQGSAAPAWLMPLPTASLIAECLLLTVLLAPPLWPPRLLTTRHRRALAIVASGGVLAWTLLAAALAGRGGPPGWLTIGAALFLLGTIGAALMLLAQPIRRGGLFDSTGLRDLVNRKLREKLRQHYGDMGESREPPEVVTFADIDPVAVPACRSLKVVATDVAARQLVLFDAATPGVAVADAVVASAAIPFAFPPPTVRGWTRRSGTVFADGGLVSNLPAWVFTVEKRALERQHQGPPVRTIAFTLKAPSPEEAPTRSLFAYIANVVQTGIFGSQTIVEQFVPDLEVIELRTELTTLGFDCGRDAAYEAFSTGREAALAVLADGRAMRDQTGRVLAGIRTLMIAEIARLQPAAPAPRLRLYLVDPNGPPERESSEFRVTATAGMDAATDDRLPLDPRNTAAPAAYRERKPVYVAVAGLTARELWMTRYEHALLASDLCSIIAVPVFGKPPPGTAKPPPQRVLCLDSNGDLRAMFDHPTFMKTLLDLSVLTSKPQIAASIGKGATIDGAAG